MASKQQETNNQPQSQCIWFDVDNNKYYLLNNETGEMKHVHKTGDWIKKFDSSLTGSVGYNERIKKAQNNPGYMPFEAKSLKFSGKNALYTPQNNKFESYGQFPNPRTQPYYNQADEYKLNRKKKLYIKDQEESLTFRNHSNQTTFKYPDLKKHSIGVSFLTGTVNIEKDSKNSKSVKVLKDRQIKPDYQEIDKIEMQKSMTSKNLVRPVSIINGRGLEPPNKTFLEASLKRTHSLQQSRKVPEIEDVNLEEQQKKDRINQLRYTQKVQSVKEKTFSYQTLPRDQTKVMTDYFSREARKERNIDRLTKKFDGLATKTYDKSIQLNLKKSDSTPKCQTISDFQNILERKQKELEGFKIPEQKIKDVIITQGRYPNVIPTMAQQFRKDRDLIMINYKDETEEKINEKKVQQEATRRILLKKVISEQMDYQEKQDSQKCRQAWKQYNSTGIY